MSGSSNAQDLWISLGRDAEGVALSRSLDVVAGRVLGLPRAEGVGAVLAAGALNDFTDADLSSVDLTGRLDLVGVRWSERGTIWPSGEEERRNGVAFRIATTPLGRIMKLMCSDELVSVAPPMPSPGPEPSVFTVRGCEPGGQRATYCTGVVCCSASQCSSKP